MWTATPCSGVKTCWPTKPPRLRQHLGRAVDQQAVVGQLAPAARGVGEQGPRAALDVDPAVGARGAGLVGQLVERLLVRHHRFGERCAACARARGRSCGAAPGRRPCARGRPWPRNRARPSRSGRPPGRRWPSGCRRLPCLRPNDLRRSSAVSAASWLHLSKFHECGSPSRRREGNSLALEHRRALFEEGGDALLVVRAAAERAHDVALQVELLVERAGPGGADQPLGLGQPPRRPAAKRASRASASSISLSSSTAFQIRPQLSACSAPRGWPVRARPSARA